MESALTFGEWLKRRRGGLGLTQKELAQLVGYAPVTMRKIEADELRPSRDGPRGLAEVLHVAEEERAAFVRFARDQGTLDAAPAVSLPIKPMTVAAQQLDWGEAPDVSHIHGRQPELAQLRRWLVVDGCRLIGLLGIGGIGKTALATLAAVDAQDQFSAIVWRSLRNAPPLGELLGQLIEVLSHRNVHEMPASLEHRTALLMDCLRGQRCLLVLDNYETVLHPDHPGTYLPGYESYGHLFKQIGEGRHQSCLLLTSREKPRELIPLASATGPVRSLLLQSLDPVSGRAVLAGRGLYGSDEAWAALHVRYSGNPLALQIVAETIAELFGGDIAAFLSRDTILFAGIEDLLAQQFARLSPLEEQVMFWLAVEREAVAPEDLGANMVPRPADGAVLTALHALRQRSFVERAQGGFTLQNVVLEYVTVTLIERVCGEIRSSDIDHLQRYSLLKATAKSYVREAQRNLILAQVAHRLKADLGQAALAQRLGTIVKQLRTLQLRQGGYAGGNILNLLVQSEIDLRGQDFSSLAVWRADLHNVSAQEIDFRGADLAQCAFMDTFAAVFSLVFSPDGQRLAAATMGNEIRVWRAADGQPLSSWVAHTGWIWSVVFSPDSSVLASAGGSEVRIWAVQDGRYLAGLLGHRKYVLALCFEPGGEVLASSSADTTVRLWDWRSGRCLRVLEGHTDWIRAISFSPDGNLLASGSNDHTVRLWDWRSAECLHLMRGHTDWIKAVRFSPDGSVVASCSDDHSVRLWQAQSGECLHWLQGHTGWVWSINFDPAGRMLASCSQDHTVRLWDVQTGRCQHVLEGHTDWVRSVCFSPDGSLLASGSDDSTVRLWDTQTGRCLHVLQGHTAWLRSICFSPVDHIVASGSDDPAVRLWDSQTGECLHILQGHTNNIWSIDLSPDGTIAAGAYEDHRVRLWNRLDGTCLHVLQGHTGWLRAVCFSPDGSLVVSGGDDQTVRLWDSRSGVCRHVLYGHGARVRSVSFSPDGSILASSGDDKLVRLWDSQTGRSIRTLQGHTGWVWTTSFSPDGSMLASADDDHTLRLWDWRAGVCMRVLQGDMNSIWTACFSPDGRVIAGGGDDQSIGLWDSQTGACLRVIEGQSAWVVSVCFSPDGSLLASGGDDHLVRLWDWRTGTCLRVLEGHTAWVRAVRFSSDGEIVASGSDDQTIRIWDVRTGECLRVLQSDRPYQGMNIARATGLTAAEVAALRHLGAQT